MNFLDRVLETTSTIGLGAYALAGSLPGFQRWAGIGGGSTAPSAVWEVDADGNPDGAWEVALNAQYDSGANTLTRGTFSASSTGAPINWGAGNKYVAMVLPASLVQQLIDALDNFPDFSPPTIPAAQGGGAFTLPEIPVADSLSLFWNGMYQQEGLGKDFTLTANVIQYLTAGPQSGDAHVALYRR